MFMKLGKTLILGDSYSAFEGYIPKNYTTWYKSEKTDLTDVNKVEQMWWYELFDGKENVLLRNDAFSGTTICNTVRPELSVETSFLSRFDALISNGYFKNNKLDTIIIFGCTNDNWLEVPFGEAKYDNFTEDDLLQFYPACCYLASRMNEAVPNANILWFINSNLMEKFPIAIKTVAEHFGQKYLQFEKIHKLTGHPSAEGMKQIEETIKKFLINN